MSHGWTISAVWRNVNAVASRVRAVLVPRLWSLLTNCHGYGLAVACLVAGAYGLGVVSGRAAEQVEFQRRLALALERYDIHPKKAKQCKPCQAALARKQAGRVAPLAPVPDPAFKHQDANAKGMKDGT